MIGKKIRILTRTRVRGKLVEPGDIVEVDGDKLTFVEAAEMIGGSTPKGMLLDDEEKKKAAKPKKVEAETKTEAKVEDKAEAKVKKAKK